MTISYAVVRVQEEVVPVSNRITELREEDHVGQIIKIASNIGTS